MGVALTDKSKSPLHITKKLEYDSLSSERANVSDLKDSGKIALKALPVPQVIAIPPGNFLSLPFCKKASVLNNFSSVRTSDGFAGGISVCECEVQENC
jgi:hypothetical protein